MIMKHPKIKEKPEGKVKKRAVQEKKKIGGLYGMTRLGIGVGYKEISPPDPTCHMKTSWA